MEENKKFAEKKEKRKRRIWVKGRNPDDHLQKARQNDRQTDRGQEGREKEEKEEKKEEEEEAEEEEEEEKKKEEEEEEEVQAVHERKSVKADEEPEIGLNRFHILSTAITEHLKFELYLVQNL